MTLLKNDIELSSTEEAEERNTPEVEVVRDLALSTQALAGSRPVGSTDNWEVEKLRNGDFNIKKACAIIDGKGYNRLSVMT